MTAQETNSDGSWSHVDDKGDAHMVDVGAKSATTRRAVAVGRVRMAKDTLERIRAGTHIKGNVLGVARIAGIQAAKRTAELIPLCHPLPVDSIQVSFSLDDVDSVEIRAEVGVTAKTGVEMEALTATAIAALTIYDMCKAVDAAMVIEDVHLEEKTGGKKGHYKHPTAD